MIEWGEVPWTLRAFALLSLGDLGRTLFQVHHTPAEIDCLSVVVVLAWIFFLLKGVRGLWIVTLVIFGLEFVETVILGPRIWWSLLLTLIYFGLLLAPPSCLYFARRGFGGHLKSNGT